MNYKKNFKEKGYVIIEKFLNKGQLNNIKNEIKDITVNQIKKFKYKVRKKDLKIINCSK